MFCFSIEVGCKLEQPLSIEISHGDKLLKAIKKIKLVESSPQKSLVQIAIDDKYEYLHGQEVKLVFYARNKIVFFSQPQRFDFIRKDK